MVLKDREYKKRKAMDALFYISFMIIPVIAFALFYVYVNLDSFIMAFQKPVDGKLVFAKFDNFKWVFEKLKNGAVNDEDNLRLAFVNTFKTFGVQMIMFPIGLFVSYFIYKKIFGYKVFRVIFYLPTLISGVVVSFFYLALMQDGFMPKFLQNLYNLDYKLVNPLVDSDFANKMVLLHFVWLNFPGSLIIWGGTFSRIPESVLESARLDGVNWVQEMFVMPVISSIVEKLEDTEMDDATLSEIISEVDAGATSSSLCSRNDFNRIKEARNLLYNNAAEQYVFVPKYSVAKEGSKEFLKYFYSDEGLAKFMTVTGLPNSARLSDESKFNVNTLDNWHKQQFTLSKEMNAVTNTITKSKLFINNNTNQFASVPYAQSLCAGNSKDKLTADSIWNKIVAKINENWADWSK